MNPLLYGEETSAECGNIQPARDKLELSLLPAILRTQMPVFGICRGIQVMNIALGGTLFQDVDAEYGGSKGMGVGHYQKAGDAVQTHSVYVKKDTLLYDIVGKQKFFVNSFHHQAIKVPGEGILTSAAAPDGVIEAVELKNHKFFLGVQWHPEHLYDCDRDMEKLWNAFVESCK